MVIAHQDDGEARGGVVAGEGQANPHRGTPRFGGEEAAITGSKWNCLLQPRGGRHKRVRR